MDAAALVTFVAAVLLGSYVQGVTGFALGIIVIAIVTATHTNTVPPVAAAISLLTVTNVLGALYGHHRDVDRRFLAGLSLGQVPAIVAGVWVLGFLDANSRATLELLLGAFVTAGSLSMAIRPKPIRTVSRFGTILLAGTAGGLIGGMFAVSGPVTGWFTYRQPLPIGAIRATLLAGFVVTGVTRTIVVAARGELGVEVLTTYLLGLPAVILGTVLARRFRPVVSDAAMRRGVFSLLCAVGVWIMASAYL